MGHPLMKNDVLEIATAYTRFPAGRYRSDGKFSGERFREDFLIPVLEKHGKVTINLDGVMGYGSSFLEEVFGGLLRSDRIKGLPKLDGVDLRTVVHLVSRDRSLVDEINEYLSPTHH